MFLTALIDHILQKEKTQEDLYNSLVWILYIVVTSCLLDSFLYVFVSYMDEDFLCFLIIPNSPYTFPKYLS